MTVDAANQPLRTSRSSRGGNREGRSLFPFLVLLVVLGLLFSVSRASGSGTGGPTIEGESAAIALYDGSLHSYDPYSGAWTTVASTDLWQVFGWSPDHSKLAYVAGHELYVWDGSSSTGLYDFSTDFSGAAIDQLVWSPDGESVAWVAEGCACDPIGVTNVVSHTTAVYDETTTGISYSQPRLDWAPAGGLIVFSAVCGSGCSNSEYSNLFELDTDNATITQLTTGNNSYSRPIWSPDGSQLLYANTDSFELCHRPAPGGSGSSGCYGVGDELGYNGYAWAPNGDWAALDVDKTLFVNGTQKGSTGAFADDGPLSQNPWSPDSAYLLLTREGEAGDGNDELVDASDGSATDLGSPFGTGSTLISWAYPFAPLPASTGPAPEAGASLTQCAGFPVLSGRPGPDIASVTYQFQVATDTSFSTPVADSGALPATNTWSPAAGSLTQGTTYYWRWRIGSGTWSIPRSFTLAQTDLGAAGPTWSDGPLAVNEKDGNLLVSLPGPSFPSAAGSLAASVSYNSLNTADDGLGAGWTLDTGASDNDAPLTLLDRNAVGGIDRIDAVQALNGDGSSSCYSHVGTTDAYISEPGDGTQLTKAVDGTWTYSSGNTVATYTAEDSNGVARLTSIESTGASAGTEALTYTYSTTDPTKIASVEDEGGRALAFTWHSLSPTGCSDAIVCIEGPDSQTWKLVGDAGSGTSGKLQSVWDGTRSIAAVAYNGSGLLDTFQNADDLDPPSVSYNGSHALAVSYDGSGRVSEVDNGPITGQTPDTSSWTFDYHPGSVSLDATRAAHGTLAASTVRTGAGYTAITPPNQQGATTPATTNVYYDDHGNLLERKDTLGRITEAGYNANDEQTWSEDADGNPTDYDWDTVDDVLLAQTDPDPDGAGPAARPETDYRYDEQEIGTPSTAGTALEGLAASYYDNVNLAGRPAAQETDATVDYDWGSSGPPALTATSDYSVRWSGDLIVTEAGDYTFSTNASDGTRLIIDGVAAIDNWVDQTETVASSQPVTLAAGKHRIELDYYDGPDASHVHLRWACGGCSPAISTQVIPTTALTPAWLNRTSTVSPTGRIAFSHFDQPWTADPDYSLVKAPINGSTANLITSYSYDSAGRLTGKVMPNGNTSATLTSGTLSGAGNPATGNYGTSYSYYSDSDTASPPAACGGGSAVNQSGQLETKSEHGLHDQTFVYDIAGDEIASTNAAGTTCNSYDDEGRLTDTTAPSDSNATTYTYDPAGNTLEQAHSGTSDDTSGTVTTTYDEAGRVIDTVDANGAEASYSYDADGNQISRTAAKGLLASSTNYTTDYSYDAADQLSSETDSASHEFDFFYDNRGNLRGTQYPNGTFSWTDTDPDGNTTDHYNRHGTINSTTTTAPADTNPISDDSYSYNADGQVSSDTRFSVVPHAFPATPLLDDFNRASLGSSWTVEGGSLTIDSSTILKGSGYGYLNAHNYGPDVEASATLSTLSTSGVMDVGVRYSHSTETGYGIRYDPTYPTQLFLYRFDSSYSFHQLANPVVAISAGDKIGIRAIGNTISGYLYHGGAWTQIASVTDTTYNRSGRIWAYIGDTTGRLDNLNGGTLDPTGFPASTTPQLDDFNRASLGSTWTVEGGSLTIDSSTTLKGNGYGYLNAHNYGPDVEASATLSTLGTTGDMDVDVRYDHATQTGYGIRYDPTYPTQLFLYRFDSGYSFHTLANPLGLVISAGDKIGIRAVGNTISGYLYHAGAWTQIASVTDTTYNRSGRIWVYLADTTGRLDNLNGGTLQQTSTYTYDGAGRLETVTNPDNTSLRYCYDADSNRTYQMGDAADSCGSSGATSTYTYNTGTHTPLDALTNQTGPSHTYTYDGAGTTSGDGMITGNGTDTYNWDSQLRLKVSTDTTGSVCYRYSPDGTLKTRTYDSTGNSNCTTATTTTKYLLGDLYETNGSNSFTTTYTDGPSGDLAAYTGSPTTSKPVAFLYYNAHGDLAAETDPTGYATVTHTYDAFGTPLDATPANATTHRYTGAWNKNYDTTSSLILMGARAYNPNLGRFLSVDPIDGGSLNNYDYAGQDPVNGYDLDGELPGTPGDQDEVPGPEDARVFQEASTRKGMARISMRQFFRQVEEFESQDADTVFNIIRRYARRAGWKWVRTGSGWRFYDTQTNEQLRFSDEHGNWRLYAQFRDMPRRQGSYGQAELTGNLTTWP